MLVYELYALKKKKGYELIGVQKVCSQSVSSLAKEMGISDVGLAKICKRYDIPRPGLRCWAKKQAGLKVQRKRVPKGDGDGIIVVGYFSNSLVGMLVGMNKI